MTTHTVQLSDDLEKIAVRQAELVKASVDEYLSSLLEASLRVYEIEQVEPGSLSGAEMIAKWERNNAFIDGSDLPDSVEYARQLRERAPRRV